MTRRNWIIAGSGAAIVVVAGLSWLLFFRDDSLPPFTLQDAVNATTPGSAASGPDGVTTTGPGSSSSPLLPGAIWTIDQGGTEAGYRIQEELAGIGGNTAVGRTSDVTGSFRLSGSTVDVVSITVNMASLVSDDSQRDRQLRSRGLQTNDFPSASFTLTTPIELGTAPRVGEAVSVAANGALALHGVTRDVLVALDAQFLDAGSIVIVGSVEIMLSDYGIEAPTGFKVLTVADVGEFEFTLRFVA
jgi:polyisoprenoid-binding protein YceI